MSTGMPRSRARSRSRTFTSSESASSIEDVEPVEELPRGSSAVTPSSTVRQSLTKGSSSAIRRAATTALFTPRSSTVAGMRLRFERSSASKSASRSAPHSPSSARV